MSAPKPGDRVRVTYEGRWSGKNPETGALGYVEADMGGWLPLVPRHATVEVLASPVYVNHDTTEYREGDIARDDSRHVWLFQNERWWPHPSPPAWQPGRFPHELSEPITLLVRDGETVR